MSSLPTDEEEDDRVGERVAGRVGTLLALLTPDPSSLGQKFTEFKLFYSGVKE